MNKQHFPYIYLILSLGFLVSFYFVNEMAMAKFLGTTLAVFSDSLFLTILILGLVFLWKFDVLLCSLFVALLYSLMSFSAVSEWHQQLGIYEGATSLILSQALRAFFPTILIYSLVVAVKNIFSKKITTDQSERVDHR